MGYVKMTVSWFALTAFLEKMEISWKILNLGEIGKKNLGGGEIGVSQNYLTF